MNLIQWDKDLLVSLNACHNEFWDGVMWMATDEISWVPFFLVLLYLLFKTKGKEFILIVVAIALTIVICDQVSGIFKEWIARPRPSREPGIMNQLHIVNGYRGGKYGYFSAHAANTFGIAVLVIMLLRNWLVTTVMLAWCALESYTRIYLGVHYPLDILTGVAFGSCTGFFVYKLHLALSKRFVMNGKNSVSTSEAFPLFLSFIFVVFMLMVGSKTISDFLL